MPQINRTKTFALKGGGLDGNLLRGVASVAGVLDSYDDVIMPGALSESVLSEFRATGFVADSHDWSAMIAMPIVAEVRGVDLYTEAEFHSTADAQAVRTKCAERIDRGLSVGLSIGFMVAPTDYRSFTSGDALLKWAEGAGYSLGDLDTEGIRACNRRCQAITNIARLIEYSVVAIPANPASWATEVRSAGLETSVFKGDYLGPWAEGEACYNALCSLTYDLKYGPLWDSIFGTGVCSGMSSQERTDYLTSAYAEYTAISLRLFSALVDMLPNVVAAPEEEDDDTVEMCSAAFDAMRRAYFPAPVPIPAGEAPAASLASQADTVHDAVEALAARSAAVLALRRADGRTISATTRSRIASAVDALRAACDTLAAIRAESAPMDWRAEVRAAKAQILRTLHHTNR